eukprot:scaffold16.g136.t1
MTRRKAREQLVPAVDGQQESTPSSLPAVAAEAAPGSARAASTRRGRAAAGAAAPALAAVEDEEAVQPAKKPRRTKILPHGGATSAANLQALPDNKEEAKEDNVLSPLSPDAPSRRTSDALMEAVVKVFCVHSEPNFSLPWQRKRQYSSSGSGFAIAGRRLLTNAHCVDHHTQARALGWVKVKRRGSDQKFVATVLAVGMECDIAMLAVEDEAFWEGLEPVSFGQLPRLQDSVTVIGYPVGGDTMSVTSGVVSRIEVTGYVHGAAELLGIQVDAAINSGNSGGPAFNDRGECVGIAFQSLKNEDTENISYVIPSPVIHHFIDDYARHGRYTGFPALGMEWQKMESPVLRQALGMRPGQRGVLVRRVEPTSPLSKVVKQGDVLLSFEGVDIGSDGTVPFRSGERIGFSYLISQKFQGEKATLRVLHDGKEEEVEVMLQGSTRLIPVHINNRPPSYYIFGGLVFSPVTVPLLRSEYGKDFDYDAPVKLLDKMLHAMADKPGQQIVVLSQVLAHESNVGFEEIVNTQVLQVNGVAVNNLRELVRELVILDREAAVAGTKEILEQHCIPADRSADLQAAPELGEHRSLAAAAAVPEEVAQAVRQQEGKEQAVGAKQEAAAGEEEEQQQEQRRLRRGEKRRASAGSMEEG